MKMKKAYIILIIILVIFFLVMFFVFGLDNIKKNSYDTTIIVGEDTIWVYKKQKWMNTFKYEDFNWKEYDVYLNNEIKGNYYLTYNDKWYAFDNKKNAILLDGDLLAIKSNYDISVSNFDTNEISDLSYVNRVLEDNKISKTSKFTVSHKIDFDYDNDGEEEEFYVISNAFPMDFDPEKIFSLVFMVKDKEIYPIYTDISDNTGFNGCKPYFNSFIDVDNDSRYEFILNCAKYSTNGVSRMLYKYDNNEFKILISNNK